MSNSSHLRRVGSRLAGTILTWCRDRLAVDRVFHLSDLEAHITETVGGTPGSAGRVLRDLRQSGELDYELTSRSESRYRLVRVGPAPARRIVALSGAATGSSRVAARLHVEDFSASLWREFA